MIFQYSLDGIILMISAILVFFLAIRNCSYTWIRHNAIFPDLYELIHN